MFDRRVIRFELSPYYPLVLCSSEHQSILNKSFLEETLTVWTMSAPQFPHLQITTQSASRNPQKRRLKMSHWEMLFCLEGWEKYLEIIKLTFSKLLLDRQLLLRSEPCDDQGEEERNESLRLEEIPYLREERQTTFAAVQTENIERYCYERERERESESKGVFFYLESLGNLQTGSSAYWGQFFLVSNQAKRWDVTPRSFISHSDLLPF